MAITQSDVDTLAERFKTEVGRIRSGFEWLKAKYNELAEAARQPKPTEPPDMTQAFQKLNAGLDGLDEISDALDSMKSEGAAGGAEVETAQNLTTGQQQPAAGSFETGPGGGGTANPEPTFRTSEQGSAGGETGAPASAGEAGGGPTSGLDQSGLNTPTGQQTPAADATIESPGQGSDTGGQS